VSIIQPRRGWQPIELGELWRFRELVFFLTWRDVKVRYKQTVLGGAWAVLQPLMASIVFVVLFGRMANMAETVDAPYLVFVYAGMLSWQFCQAAVTQSSQSLVNSSNLISKVYFPRLAVPMSAVGACLVDFVVSLGVMVVLLAGHRLLPPVQVVLLPLFVAGTMITSLGVGTLLSALTVAYRDFRYVVPFFVQMWMFLTPAGYPLQKVPVEWHRLYFVNPMAGMVQGFRWCLLNEPLDPVCLAISSAVAAACLFVGTVYFRRIERRFADIV
jgi:lipopolysaccharide transport system permease protein